MVFKGLYICIINICIIRLKKFEENNGIVEFELICRMKLINI